MNKNAPERPVKSRLRVEVIDTYAEFLIAEKSWKALEDKDPETTVFLSWDWLAQAFRDNPYRWSVIAVRDPDSESDLVGLMPLKYRVHWSSTRNEFQTEIEAGGRLIFSEYTGFLCRPDVEVEALEAMATALRGMPWAKLSMRYVAQKRRAEAFCASFERSGYPVSWKEYRINKGETNNLICPQVTLPDTFESYLKSNISANSRQKYSRFQRNYFAEGEYHFTHCDKNSFDTDVATLMKFWKQKWIPEKGKSSATKVAINFEKVLKSALDADALFLPMLWRGDTPLAALGHVMDPKVGAMHFIIAGRDTSAEEEFIGAALHFHSIECAILLGCQYYDFGHGDEEYKFGYGAEKTELHYFSIKRPDPHAEMVFDSISIGSALARVQGFIKAGKTEQAQRACRQLSELFK